MSQSIRFVLALHNHQPVGNFDEVFERAYQDSYRQFLDLLDRFPDLSLSLHVSGSLMEWLDVHHPEYVDRLADCVAAGRIEILGGAFYEPILTMIPPRDRVGQIRDYTTWLQERLGANVRGMWIPERVWEQGLVSDLAEAGIQYTLLDDFHFRSAGLDAEQLHGYYVSEDDGKLLFIFPGSERLRYLIPFGQVREIIEHLGRIAEHHADAVVVFGDDGEKFGTWPETKKHVYENGWLAEFFEALSANQDWIKTTTLGEAVDNVAPVGKVYLPDASYREMTEWALPVSRLTHYEDLRRDMQSHPRWEELGPYMRGGFWRNFKVKYFEANEMYARMMMVSDRLRDATEKAAGVNGRLPECLDYARRELYRAQCNCGYWHGAFGGIYLPHLRNAIYNHLIAADNLLDQANPPATLPDAKAGDFDFDARQEVRMTSRRLIAMIAPARGGQLYELDVRSICHNLLATFNRRPEAYHAKVLAGAGEGDNDVASIHDRVVFKQEGLDKQVRYDHFPRKSLLDHFYDNDASLESVAAGEAPERGDFVTGVYETRIRRSPGRVEVQLSRQGNAWGHPIRITKTVTMEADRPTLEVSYLLEDLPREPLHLAVEWNFAGLPAGADDRYFRDGQRQALGQLGSHLDLRDVTELGLVDEYLGIDVSLSASDPTDYWAFPIQTVSQSEGCFELIHQSVAVLPHWIVQPDPGGRWRVTLQVQADTTLAESRMQQAAIATS